MIKESMIAVHDNTTQPQKERLHFAAELAPQAEPKRKQSTTPHERSNFEPHMIVIFALVFLTALAIFATLRVGADYYLTQLAERPQHPLHESFKASGFIGQGLGLLGGLFCMLTLLYPLRKRWRALENFGTPRTWFQFHVYFGIAGPLFATLHTTFKFGGLASISYWSMMIVMASGFIGRFLFALLPRNQRGVALSLKEIEAEIRVVQNFLATQGIREGLSGSRPSAPTPTANEWRALFFIWRVRRRELRYWNQSLRAQRLPAAIARRISSLFARKIFLESSRITLHTTTRLFSYWHALHLPFTLLMFITLLVHVGLALLLGYTWIF